MYAIVSIVSIASIAPELLKVERMRNFNIYYIKKSQKFFTFATFFVILGDNPKKTMRIRLQMLMMAIMVAVLGVNAQKITLGTYTQMSNQ